MADFSLRQNEGACAWRSNPQPSLIGSLERIMTSYYGKQLRVRATEASLFNNFQYTHSPNVYPGNENVDKLAKAALNRTSSSGKLICVSDLKPKVNAYIHTVWQENWDAEGANNLHEVLPNLGEDLSKRCEGAGRKLETVMCRLRVGHTWLTQSYLLKNEEQLFCYA
ncbi:ribonuclease hi [Plakobranchus ocellatus]|uniref:Ribonuclease hi n=1 Tax=Plakobranchus ocellatus TaxID=259542 RepID=A0AAV4B995_9GAST|nr:ribonuclease hi [Plakobranchus ocellatus]